MCLRHSDCEGVESDAGPNPARALTTVPECDGHHAVRHTREDEDWKFERAAGVIETDHIPVRKTESLGSPRAHEGGVVPRQLGEGIGKLLQPAVVRVAS